MAKVKTAIEEEMITTGKSPSWRADEDDYFQVPGNSRVITHRSENDPMQTVKDLASNYQPKAPF